MKQKIVNYLKINYKKILFILALIIINIFSLNKFFKNSNSIFVRNYSKLVFLAFNLFEILLFVIANYMLKKKKSLEKIFLSVIIPIGLCYMIFIPLGRVPDEGNHAKRAYEISEGHLASTITKKKVSGRSLNINIKNLFEYKSYNTYKSIFKLKETNKRTFLSFANTSLYSFVCYIPQALGIFIARIISLPLVLQLYAGRFVNFIVWTVLMYFAIKYIPYRKNCVFAFTFTPIILQEATSLSADALTNGISFFLISYVFHLKENKEMVTKRDFIIISLASIILSMCKIVYLPICLILFIIPYDKFSTKKKKYLKIGLLALIVVLFNLIWLKISSSYLIEYNKGVNSAAQVSFVLHNPITYIQYSFNTIYENISAWLFCILGISLCWFDVNLSYFYIFIILFLFLYLLLFDNDKKIENKSKILTGVITFGTIVLIFTSLYVQWTPVGKNIIDGIQGRYFIPLLIPIAILLNFPKISLDKKENINLRLVVYILLFVNVYALMTIFFTHMI